MSSSNKCRSVIYRRFGKPDVLELVDGPMPELTSEDGVLVQVSAVSLNPKDTLLRKGKFNKVLAREPMPRGTALDASGEVIAVGANVSRLTPGDRVFGMTNRFCGGLLRDVVELREDELALAPTVLSLEHAASIPLAALTALQGLRDCGACRRGSRVLIVGATGGVGHFAVQIGAILGAHVSAVCGGKNRDFALSLGADQVFCYDEQDLSQLSEKFDVVFDVSGKYEPQQFGKQLTSRELLAKQTGSNGVFISTVPKFSSIAGELLSRLKFRQNSRLVIVKSNTRDLQQLAEWVDGGQLRPIVSQEFDVTDIQAAHASMQTGHTTGKLIVTL